MAHGDFPKYLMKVDGKRHFLNLAEAARAYDNGLVTVDFGRYVLHHDYSVDKMTADDRRKISDAADRYAASK
jgi:hypothetical protein